MVYHTSRLAGPDPWRPAAQLHDTSDRPVTSPSHSPPTRTPGKGEHRDPAAAEPQPQQGDSPTVNPSSHLWARPPERPSPQHAGRPRGGPRSLEAVQARSSRPWTLSPAVPVSPAPLPFLGASVCFKQSTFCRGCGANSRYSLSRCCLSLSISPSELGESSVLADAKAGQSL